MDFWSSTYDHRRSLDRSRGRSLDHRSLGRSLDRSLGRSVARSLDRSIARSLDRSLDRSVARSLGRWIARSLDRMSCAPLPGPMTAPTFSETMPSIYKRNSEKPGLGRQTGISATVTRLKERFFPCSLLVCVFQRFGFQK